MALASTNATTAINATSVINGATNARGHVGGWATADYAHVAMSPLQLTNCSISTNVLPVRNRQTGGLSNKPSAHQTRGDSKPVLRFTQ